MFNFENLNATQDIQATTYDHASGKGGILAFRVKNELRVDASLANRYIKATGAGRDSSTALDMSGCPNGTPCLFMGQNTNGTTGQRGGGIIFVSARKLLYSNGPSSSLYFYANAGTTTAPNTSSGGTMIAQFGTIVYDYLGTNEPASLPSSKFHTNGSTGGVGGYSKFEYCNTEDPNASGGSIPSPVTASGNIGTLEVNPTPDYCSAL